MKKKIQIIPIAAIAVVGTMFSCVDSGKDLYDPSYETSNPMGDGFAAPDGFDWNTIATKNVTVEVKDEEGGLYSYLVEIYTEDPLANGSAFPIAIRTANKENNFKVTASISLLPTQKGVYVKQTDPRGREQVYPFSLPEDSDNLTCKLYYTDTTSRALMSRANATRSVSLEKPDYTSIPAGAQEIEDVKDSNLQAGASYKISNDYEGVFKFSGQEGKNKTKVFVDAKWTIPEAFSFQNGIEIIVMNGAEIVAHKDVTFIRNSMLTIMDGGNVNIKNITFTNGEPAGLRNWGTLSVTNLIKLSSGASLYNKGVITSKNITVNSNSKIINDNKIELKGDLYLPSNFSIVNNGELYGKSMTAESPDAIITNTNIIIFEKFKFTNPTVNNSCSMEATQSLITNGVKFNFDKGYLKAPTMEFRNGEINLSNGSMLEATISIDLKTAHAKFYGKGENTSLIKSPKISGQGFTYDGNLAVECNDHPKMLDWENYTVKGGAYITKIGDSKVFIETCDGIKNGGNGGDTPGEPEYPIIVEDTRSYAYLFEDQWPLYGDYDMNDVSIVIKNRKIATNKDNKVTEFALNIELAAAGATKSIGAAIMLDGVSANAITQPVEFGDNSLFRNFNLNGNQIESGQDYAVIPLFDDAHRALGRDRYEQINTIVNHTNNTNPKNINLTIKFNNPTLSADEFNIDKLNVFIFVDGNRNNRKEIHVAGYQPSKLANTALFGGNNDDSSVSGKKYYISKENLAWGIMVPTDFKWPLEYVNIKVAYSLFEGWVTSGGTKNEAWWEIYDVSKVYK